MDDQKRGKDAADVAPRPREDGGGGAATRQGGADGQDAANYRDRTDGGRALKSDEVSSANDE